MENNQQASNGAQQLTTRQGHPVTDNQNLRTIGSRGPATLENYHFLEKMSHFDRERIPERVVHAREPVHTVCLKHTVLWAMNQSANIPVQNFFRRKENKHLFSFASLL